jgi:4-hydroxy-tetrahydrodipicolinate synthase
MAALIDGRTNGVMVISVTPFTERGDVDWPSVDSLVEFYLEKGVTGVTILGMMGEAPKMTDSESLEFATYFLKRVGGRVPVVVGVSNAGLNNLARLAHASMDAGAAGVMVAPGGQKTEAQIKDYFAAVSAALGKIPFCYQDYPQTTGVHISVATFLDLVRSHDNLVMFKHEDWPGLKKLQAIRRQCDGQALRRISILCGNGGLHLPQEMARGADGAMTGFAYPEMLVEVVKAYQAGCAADGEDLFDIYLPLVRHEQQAGIGLALRKEVLRRRGAIRSAAVRASGPKLDTDDLAELDRLVARLEHRLAQRGRTTG